MHIDLVNVLNKYTFLNPVYTEYNHFMISYLDQNDFSLNSQSNGLYNVINTGTKEVVLNKYNFRENYVKYEFENELLNNYYKVLSHATVSDITSISHNDEDKIKYGLNYSIMRFIGNKIRDNAYIIISPLIYYYIAKIETFIFNNESSVAFRCKKVGTLYGSIDVYVDYYIETDMIVLATNVHDAITLYYSNDSTSNNGLYFNLVINNKNNFKNNIVVLRDIKEHDPMEKNMIDSDPTEFF